MMEMFFSENELSKIEKDATENPGEYYDGLVLDGEATALSIFTISRLNRLIFVSGNKDTGWEHIGKRHSYFSLENYWRKKEEKMTPEDPSKFHPAMMPAIDFVKIADAIYKPGNKNITGNNAPDVFDKYTGTYSFADGKEQKYHLIVYKDRKIVHTMYPHKRTNNLKRKSNYARGVVTTKTEFNVSDAYNDLLVPYENGERKIAYSILIRKFYNHKIEGTFIQKHDEAGDPGSWFPLLFRTFNDMEIFDRDTMHSFQYGDLADFEKLIEEIDEMKVK